MKHSKFLLLLLVGLFCIATVGAAPIPKKMRRASAPWVPLEKGNLWTFVMVGAGGDDTTIVERREIAETEVIDGVSFATQTTAGATTQTYRITEDRVELVKTNGRLNASPRVIARNDMAEGDAWTWDAGGYIETRTVGKSQLLKLPAGEFEATPIKSEYAQNGAVFQKATVWYSRGVGLVKIDYEGYSHELKACVIGGVKK